MSCLLIFARNSALILPSYCLLYIWSYNYKFWHIGIICIYRKFCGVFYYIYALFVVFTALGLIVNLAVSLYRILTWRRALSSVVPVFPSHVILSTFGAAPQPPHKPSTSAPLCGCFAHQHSAYSRALIAASFMRTIVRVLRIVPATSGFESSWMCALCPYFGT